MNKHMLRASLICLVMLAPQAVLSATLGLVPSITVGDTVTVELNIAGLGDGIPPSLGAFFVEVEFDEGILGFDSVTYGSFLGDPTDPLETDINTTVDPGIVGLDEFSFLSDSELDALQPDSFPLASLRFTGLTVGTSAITFNFLDLSDAVGSSILDPGLESTSIVVIPVPSSLVLIASALAAWAGFAGRRRLAA